MAQEMTCSALSRSRNEPLAGTVKPTGVYFLIETNATEYGGWGHEVVKQASKSGEFAPYINHLYGVKHTKTKVLFIRRPQSDETNFYVAICNQDEPKIYHAMLDGYSDLLNVDIASITADATPTIAGRAMTKVSELYAICTNGKHDVCCSTYGVPLYNTFLQHADVDQVWQVTHIGGHRMAATMICFPQGIVYGHLDPFNAEEIVMNHRAGYMLNHKYRGRSTYSNHTLDVDTVRAVQYAEYSLRDQHKKYAINDLRLVSAELMANNTWRVSFAGQSGETYQAVIEMGMSEAIISSCGAEPEPQPIYTVKADVTEAETGD